MGGDSVLSAFEDWVLSNQKECIFSFMTSDLYLFNTESLMCSLF